MPYVCNISGTSAIGVPGRPLFAFRTASTAAARIV
jgi:hypothetical protein